MPITKQREPLCHKPIPDELLEKLSSVLGEDGVECGLEHEHRGACILATETGTFILQVAWWKHNFPPLVPHVFAAGDAEAGDKCATCGQSYGHLVGGARIHVPPPPPPGPILVPVADFVRPARRVKSRILVRNGKRTAVHVKKRGR